MSIIPGAKASSRTGRAAGAAVHKSAVVSPDARLGEGAEVGPFCVIGPNVTIGPGAVLHNNVTIVRDTTLGADCTVHPYAVLGADPQDLKHRGERTELVIGDGTSIREHATLHRGTALGGGRTVIGSDCLIMVGVHIAHDCIVEDEVVIANGAMMGGHCLIETGATIAGAAALHHFTTVGRYAFVGGMARISRDVPPYLVVEGSPAEPRKVNTTALQRRKWPERDVETLKKAYRALFRSDNGPMQHTMERLRAEPGQADCVLKLCDFLERMSTGVHGRWRETLRDPEAAARLAARD